MGELRRELRGRMRIWWQTGMRTNHKCATWKMNCTILLSYITGKQMLYVIAKVCYVMLC